MSLITLNEGKDLLKQFKDNLSKILADSVPASTLPTCETFSRDDIQALLDVSGCEAIRVYLGMDSTGEVRMVLTAVNNNQEDILPSGDEVIAENGERCPTICPPNSPINS